MNVNVAYHLVDYDAGETEALKLMGRLDLFPTQSMVMFTQAL